MLIAFVLAIGSILSMFIYQNLRGVPEGELAARVSGTDPEWANYQEDIKAQIGAAPVAEWRGEPVAAQADGDQFRVTFNLEGPWAERKVALPILLRDATESTFQNSWAQIVNEGVVYGFELPGKNVEDMPWVVLKFPHNEKRLVLTNGRWESPVS